MMVSGQEVDLDGTETGEEKNKDKRMVERPGYHSLSL